MSDSNEAFKDYLRLGERVAHMEMALVDLKKVIRIAEDSHREHLKSHDEAQKEIMSNVSLFTVQIKDMLSDIKLTLERQRAESIKEAVREAISKADDRYVSKEYGHKTDLKANKALWVFAAIGFANIAVIFFMNISKILGQ